MHIVISVMYHYPYQSTHNMHLLHFGQRICASFLYYIIIIPCDL